ncbi:MAG: FAD/NAD(P)-binding protein [Nanoarchaeota archaeon]|nr:FAD/NAD(P)-binding protein [Nanoarchaeota archaeon]
MIYTPKKVKIEFVREIGDNVFLIRIKSKIDPKPGQFLQVYIPNIGECPISNASYNKEYVDLLINNVGDVTNKLCGLKKGDFLFIRGHYGKGYPLKCMQGKNLVIIGGGCGSAPLRSVIEYVDKHRLDFKQIYVFLGFRDSENILFKDDIIKWEKKYNVEVTVDKGDKNWKGDVGLITKLLEKSKLNSHDKIVMMCGPPVMIKFVIDVLKKFSFKEDQMYVSLERHMKCGVKKCGHCMIRGKYVCEDGPVFRYDEVNDE